MFIRPLSAIFSSYNARKVVRYSSAYIRIYYMLYVLARCERVKRAARASCTGDEDKDKVRERRLHPVSNSEKLPQAAE